MVERECAQRRPRLQAKGQVALKRSENVCDSLSGAVEKGFPFVWVVHTERPEKFLDASCKSLLFSRINSKLCRLRS